MRPKVNFRIPVDIAMTALLLFQMGYHLWGDQSHEWIGGVLFLLFVVHQLLNRNWYKSLFKGRYTPLRVFRLAVDLLVIAAMAVQMYSGVVLSRYLFRFLPIHGGMARARRLHILGAYWGYLLIGLHLGLHWGAMLGTLKKRLPASGNLPSLLPRIAGLLTAAYGLFVLLKRNLADNLFLRTEFVFQDFGESKLLFYLDYLALMGLCIFLAHYFLRLLRRLQTPKEDRPGKR